MPNGKSMAQVDEDQAETFDQVQAAVTRGGVADWLVWSGSRQMWWRPASAGYSGQVAEAGWYTRREVQEIEERSRHRGPERSFGIPVGELMYRQVLLRERYLRLAAIGADVTPDFHRRLLWYREHLASGGGLSNEDAQELLALAELATGTAVAALVKGAVPTTDEGGTQ